jgi:hypothetical protein
MKKLQKIFIAAVCGAFAALSASAQSSSSDQPTTQGVGTVIRVEGLASYSLDGGSKWIPLVAGQHLPPGSQLRTGYNGTVDVILGKAIALPQADWRPDRISPAADAPVRGLVTYKPSAEQNVVRLTPDSTLAIDKLTIISTGADVVGDTEINLTQGKIFASVKKLSGASQYLVKIPSGVAGVRGTLFSISVDGYTVVYETHGDGGLVLSITSPAGVTKTLLIGPGFQFNPAGGGDSPVNLTPEELHVLQKVFAAVRTIYQQVVDFSFDHTKSYVSDIRGGVGGSTDQQQ